MLLNIANQITVLRIVLILPFVICMLSVNDPQRGVWMRYIAILIFCWMGISDAVDGYLARVRKQTSRLGAFLDPLADKLLMTCACILLAAKPTSVPDYRLPGAVVVLIIGKDILLSLGFIVIYFLTGKVRIAPVFPGKLSTFLQLLMVFCVLISPEIDPWLSGWSLFVRVLWSLTAGMAVLATAIYIWHGIRYIEGFEQQTERE